MKLLRYIIAPSGENELEAVPLAHGRSKEAISKKVRRIEIFNIQGDMICIVKDTKMIGTLNLQPGFYLIREVDGNGVIVKRSKLVF